MSKNHKKATNYKNQLKKLAFFYALTLSIPVFVILKAGTMYVNMFMLVERADRISSRSFSFPVTKSSYTFFLFSLIFSHICFCNSLGAKPQISSGRLAVVSRHARTCHRSGTGRRAGAC